MKAKIFATLLVVFAMVQLSIGQIDGSKHDFGGLAWNHTSLAGNATNSQICKPCHTPHVANTTVADAPLWGHTLSSTASYTLYSSTTMNSTVAQPNGVSKLCLGCHDGSVDMHLFVGNGASATTGVKAPNVAGAANNNISSSHPISIAYSASGPGMHPDTDPGIGAGTISSTMLFGATKTVECSSCHDVHAAQNLAKLLNVTTDGSALCLKCHAK